MNNKNLIIRYISYFFISSFSLVLIINIFKQNELEYSLNEYEKFISKEYSKYYDEDFKDRYESVEAVVQDTYEGGYYTKEESEENGCVIFSIKKHRVAHLNSTACY